MFNKLVIILSFFSLTFLVPRLSLATSGCCSWHGGVSYCDSSVGTYVCNDGTYSPSCGCYYSAPIPVCVKPTIGKSGNWTTAQNGCNQDVTFTWDKGIDDDFYSIVISKYKGGDPGPLSDTSSRSFVFKDVKPGKWYINLKPGRSCGWGDTVYWEVDVPSVAPKVIFSESVISETERSLHYQVDCATKAEISPTIGLIKLGSSFVSVYPKADTEYTLTATNGTEKTTRYLAVKFPLPTPSPTPVAVEAGEASSEDTQQSTSSNGGSFLAGLITMIGVGGLVQYFRKKHK